MLIQLWLLASEDPKLEGNLPAIDVIAFRLRVASNFLASCIRELNHWIIFDDSELLESCYQVASSEKEKEKEKENRVTRARAHDVVDHEFDIFWKTYPKKTGKKAALKAFQKARKSGMPSIDGVVAAIEQQQSCDQWRRDGGQYIPNPATWLNQGRWDDQVFEKKSVHDELREWAEEKEAQYAANVDTEMLFDNSRMLPGKIHPNDKWGNNNR